MKEEHSISISDNSENEEKPKKQSKLKVSKSSIKKFNSQSNESIKRIKSKEFERNDESSYKKETKSLNYKEELHNKFCKFLYEKKFKISNEFDARHSKKFLEQKNKYLERIVLSDVIEDNESYNVTGQSCSVNNDIKSNRNNRRRKSNTQKDLKSYCIIISNYDDETSTKQQFHFTVKNSARKLNVNLKKNRNLSKYCSNKEAKNQLLGVD